ncbi:hypothetical protein [Actinoallomurus acanthiterrae]
MTLLVAIGRMMLFAVKAACIILGIVIAAAVGGMSGGTRVRL